MSIAGRVATARRWFRERGHPVTEAGGARIVATPTAPDVWDANFALPQAGADPAAMLAALDAVMSHSDWRVVVTDALTDPTIEAALALAGFAQGDPLIEMLLLGSVTPVRPLPAATFRSVVTDADWDDLIALIVHDHAEGKRTGVVDDSVGAGLMRTMRQRSPDDYRLIMLDEKAVGYGLAVCCPDGLGLIENLFTLPAMRGRGLMSAFIDDAVLRLRARGCDGVFLDALSHETAKMLYARLGFRGVGVARQWTRRVSD